MVYHRLVAMKRCIFCKTEFGHGVRAAVEHIVPQWLQKEWGIGPHGVSPTHFDNKGKVISTRSHRLNSFVSGNVCASCNNGWMSTLEAACRPLILDLAAGKRRVADVANEEALLLARWTVKTAFALHAASNWRRVVPEDHYQLLDKDDYRLPSGVGVVAHTYKAGRDFSWAQTTGWLSIIPRDMSMDEMRALNSSGYKIALKLGGLYLMVFHNPITHSREALVFGKHVPIYPRWSHPVTWIQMDSPWPQREMRRFCVFVHFLGIALGANDLSSPFASKEGVGLHPG